MNVQKVNNGINPKKEVELSQVILTCGKFTVENPIDAGRVATAFNNYRFLLSTFPKLFSRLATNESEMKQFVDMQKVFAEQTGLLAELEKLQTRDGVISKEAKLKLLCEMRLDILAIIKDTYGLTSAEEVELATIKILAASDNPLSNGPSCCTKFLVTTFILVSILLVLLSAAAGKSVDF